MFVCVCEIPKKEIKAAHKYKQPSLFYAAELLIRFTFLKTADEGWLRALKFCVFGNVCRVEMRVARRR